MTVGCDDAPAARAIAESIFAWVSATKAAPASGTPRAAATAVILVVGDDCVAQEAQALVPEMETAVVKTGLSQFTAHHLPLEHARQVIHAAAERAVRRAPEIPRLPALDSYSLEIDFSLSEIAQLAARRARPRRTR